MVYPQASLHNVVQRREQKVSRMRNERYRGMAQQVLDAGLMAQLRACISANAGFLQAVAQDGARAFGASPDVKTWAPSSAATMGKVLSTLRQVAREWSEEGQEERDACFGRVIAEIEALYPESSSASEGEVQTGRKSRAQVKIVVPGCGLGRLPMELAARGFQTQGNEFSFHMLFMSHFMLNCTSAAREFEIHPFVHSFSHVRKREFQTRAVAVPDVHSGQYMSLREQVHGRPIGKLSMVAGSFDDVYLDTKEGALEPSNPQFTSADFVVTVFFIDTAPNIFRTLDTISKLLVTGGRWINFGPLLWHYEDTQDEEGVSVDATNDDDERTGGLELTLEDIMRLLPQFGFELEKHESAIPCRYTRDPLSMGSFLYECEYWVAVKI